MDQMDNEITLSEFCELAEAEEIGLFKYRVSFMMSNNKEGAVIVENCPSKFNAKERAYLYLLYEIRKKNNLKEG